MEYICKVIDVLLPFDMFYFILLYLYYVFIPSNLKKI
jgi:hypothetical protein